MPAARIKHSGESKVPDCASYDAWRGCLLSVTGFDSPGKCVRKHGSHSSADTIQFIVRRISMILLDFHNLLLDLRVIGW